MPDAVHVFYVLQGVKYQTACIADAADEKQPECRCRQNMDDVLEHSQNRPSHDDIEYRTKLLCLFFRSMALSTMPRIAQAHTAMITASPLLFPARATRQKRRITPPQLKRKIDV